MTQQNPGWRSPIATLGLILLGTIVLSLLFSTAAALRNPVASIVGYGLASAVLGACTIWVFTSRRMENLLGWAALKPRPWLIKGGRVAKKRWKLLLGVAASLVLATLLGLNPPSLVPHIPVPPIVWISAGALVGLGLIGWLIWWLLQRSQVSTPTTSTTPKPKVKRSTALNSVQGMMVLISIWSVLGVFRALASRQDPNLLVPLIAFGLMFLSYVPGMFHSGERLRTLGSAGVSIILLLVAGGAIVLVMLAIHYDKTKIQHAIPWGW